MNKQNLIDAAGAIGAVLFILSAFFIEAALVG